MSSALNQLEDVIASKLKLIDGTSQAYPGSSIPYVYYSTTGQVNDHDNTVSIVANNLSLKVDYEILVENDEFAESQPSANCQRFRALYKIIANLRCDEIGITKNIVNRKMNDVLSDVKWLFNKNETLDNFCFYFQYLNSTREYTDNNDMINSGKLILNYVADYGSYNSNTDILTNNNYI